MAQFAEESIGNSFINVSRNRPLGFVVGVSGFVGSHLADELLKKGIQVIGVDNLSTGLRENLNLAAKHKDFHFLNQSVTPSLFEKSKSFLEGNFSRIDYFFICLDPVNHGNDYVRGVVNCLEFIKRFKDQKKVTEELNGDILEKTADRPKVVLVSSIELYKRGLEDKNLSLKEAEIRLAKYVKEHKLNARIVRLANLFGPRMHFREKDPVTRLIQASILGELKNENTSLDFSSRSLYIADAVELIIKTALSGGTAHKIYDGAAKHPIRVSDIRKILLDPIWHEKTNFHPPLLPEWPTPNLKRTMSELNWRVKTPVVEALKETIVYFKQSGVSVPPIEDSFEKSFIPDFSEKKIASSEDTVVKPNIEERKQEKKLVLEEEKKGKAGRLGGFFRRMYVLGGLGIIITALILPLFYLGMEAFLIRKHVRASADYLQKGEFSKALSENKQALVTINDAQSIFRTFDVAANIGLFKEPVGAVNELLEVMEEGVEGVNHAILGTEALFKTTKVISGEEAKDPTEYYNTAEAELGAATHKLSTAQLKLGKDELRKSLPDEFRNRADDLETKLRFYVDLVDKARSAAQLLPRITAVDGKKTYLVLLQNNLELRAGGGFIGSYGKITFEKGRLVDIFVDDVYNLDGQLKDHIAPPDDIRLDLNQSNWYLRDSNTEVDFPQSARQAEFFYNRIIGEKVHGVIAMDLTASGKLLTAVGGIDLTDYGERVDGSNLFERAISHAEVNFFPGSTAKKNYLTQLQTNLLNKVFFVSKQNWPGIIQALGESLDQKHLMVYTADPVVFSNIIAQNWGGVLPREVEDPAGETYDMLAIVDANYGVNKANYYLERSYNLNTTLGKEGQILHKLKINYRNNSPSEVFPAGRYKNKLKIYTPSGSKLAKVVVGDADITSKVTTFSDYGRTGFSMLVEVYPKQQTDVVVEYSLGKNLNFVGDTVKYKIDLIKQPGTDKDLFNWQLNYPINYKLADKDKLGGTDQEISITTDMLKDRTLQVTVQR